MTKKELLALLAPYPNDIQMKILVDHKDAEIQDLDQENILHSSETAYINADAPADQWDTEDGKVELGDGKQYLLINPIII